MKNFLLIFTLLVFTYSCKQKEETETNQNTIESETASDGEASAIISDAETTTIYLIRHAEEKRTNLNDKNPSLDVEGINRARDWATYFERTRIDTLYINKYLPTRQTATPISQQKMLKKTYYNSDRFDPEKFMEENQGKNVLIVGKRNEIPEIINSILGEEKYQEIPDEDYSTLYKLTIQDDNKNVEVLKTQ